MRQWRRDNPEKARAKSYEHYTRERAKALGEGLLPNYHWNAARTGARKRGIAFTIEREDYPIPVTCSVFGIPLFYGAYNNTPSLDRVDPTKGYVPGNVRIISRRANRLKDNATLEELRALTRYVESHSAAD